MFLEIQDLGDLSDGSNLAGLLSYYCPSELHWSELLWPSNDGGLDVNDAVFNYQLILRLLQESLSYNPCTLSIDDLVYMHR